ncbi:TolC family protein [Carboxylicivirga linearis]|uniref:TolC family protein n=1 Tax=Carboxylicivirga linearis TaxID=1628157 RepID=A0ABS5JZZ5_9BACT|nr:TolC family protein [Carboxylicivirga linearis]MBS2100438.1 TolC family protein [Carboxylicivirga linearis]
MTGKRFVLALLVVFNGLWLKAQTDSSVFTLQQLLWYVEQYHPVSIQSQIVVSQGESGVRKARGNFDPYLFAGLDQKYYDDKEYYSLLGTGLKVPTWYGIELKTGFDQNRGYNLNPQNIVPDDGLWYAGISVPVGKGLVIDKRRAELKQAKLYAQSTKAEQEKMMLSLYFDAVKKYWDWVAAYNEYQVYKEAVELAQIRLRAIKGSHEFGDRSAIDTLEAHIVVQNRQLSKKGAKLKYDNVTLELSNYLWFENGVPLNISEEMHPPVYAAANKADGISSDSLNILLNNLGFSHPDMQLMDYKLASLEIDRKLKRESFKPKLNLNYNFLNEAHGGNVFQSYSINNYKWGFNFSMPVFLREERGAYQQAKFKIQDAEIKQSQKLLELQNKLLKYYNTQTALSEQVELYADVVKNYNRMLDAERQRFESGESSLFLVNTRENYMIDARLKMISLLAKYNVSIVGVGYAAGIPIFKSED